MKHLFLKYAAFWGAVIGVSVFWLVQFAAGAGHKWVLTRVLNFYLRPTTVFPTLKELMFGYAILSLPAILSGRLCGLSIRAFAL